MAFFTVKNLVFIFHGNADKHNAAVCKSEKNIACSSVQCVNTQKTNKNVKHSAPVFCFFFFLYFEILLSLPQLPFEDIQRICNADNEVVSRMTFTPQIQDNHKNYTCYKENSWASILCERYLSVKIHIIILFIFQTYGCTLRPMAGDDSDGGGHFKSKRNTNISFSYLLLLFWPMNVPKAIYCTRILRPKRLLLLIIIIKMHAIVYSLLVSCSLLI